VGLLRHLIAKQVSLNSSQVTVILDTLKTVKLCLARVLAVISLENNILG
jgi:hypothetical protein